MNPLKGPLSRNSGVDARNPDASARGRRTTNTPVSPSPWAGHERGLRSLGVQVDLVVLFWDKRVSTKTNIKLVIAFYRTVPISQPILPALCYRG